MALQKQEVSINFGKGLDLKTDPYQVQPGNFLSLQNSVFETAGRLTKRNGYNDITTLPNDLQTTLTTLNDSLIATGSNLYAYIPETDQWLNQGSVQPVQLSVQSLLRNSTSQTGVDSAIASNGLVCTVYMDNSVAYYQITDNLTGQQVVTRTAIGSTATMPRVFVLGVYFIITFLATVAAVDSLRYIAVPVNNVSSPRAAATISGSTAGLASTGYDAVVADTNLFIAWGKSTANVGFAYLTSALNISTVTNIGSTTAALVSVANDETQQVIYITYWDSASTTAKTTAYSYIMAELMTPTTVITTTAITEVTSVVDSGVCTVFYQTTNNYSYTHSGNNIRSDFVSAVTVTRPVAVTTGTVSAATVIRRSVGLASKAFYGPNDVIYMLVAYGCRANTAAVDNSQQPTYFLIDSAGTIYMRLAYSNGGGYCTTQVLPNVTLYNDYYYTPYLITDFITTTNKGTNLPSGTPVNAIYTQTGINLAKIGLEISNQHSSEIAGSLHLTGGQLWQYDGITPVEHSFHVWPENIVCTTATGSGSIAAATYNYVFTYEWTDNAGNLHRSAPSIPVTQVTTTASSTNTIKVPTLRLTAKVSPNPVRIVGYRWSSLQQVYYQFTSVTSPTVNSTTTDSVTFTDTLADSSILGNAILYTTGGVVENIAAPASIASCMFQNRLFLIDAEDRNLLWYSKVVIQNVPVEMSDLLTLYIAPTTGAQGSTGPMTALAALDDKLIIFKKDAIYYVTGSGPDNTGANSTFSDPVFITSTTGCDNPNSIVLMPNGLMFQSDKGIWLLGRDLSTNYIGASVEPYTLDFAATSALVIPGTNQVRFIMDNNVTLVYDYYFQQWGTHTNINAISGTLYQGMHTYLNSDGIVYQEEVGRYTDGATPVLLSLTTSWIAVAGIQGYERFYFGNLLGTYHTPFKLNVSLAYDYNSSATQNIIITPDNYAPAWGGEANWGTGTWGGPGNVFTARFFPEKQKCDSFQVKIEEVYDSSLGVAPGQGLSLTGIQLTAGIKRGNRTNSAAKSFG